MKDIEIVDEKPGEITIDSEIRALQKKYKCDAAALIQQVHAVRDADQALIDDETQKEIDKINAKRVAAGLPARGLRAGKATA